MLQEDNLPQLRHCLNKSCSWSGICCRAANCHRCGRAGALRHLPAARPGLLRDATARSCGGVDR